MAKIAAIGRSRTANASAKTAVKARSPAADRPSRSQAEDAVRTLIRWAGDNPSRQGLQGTPARVARAYEEWFSGYGDCLLYTSPSPRDS